MGTELAQVWAVGNAIQDAYRLWIMRASNTAMNMASVAATIDPALKICFVSTPGVSLDAGGGNACAVTSYEIGKHKGHSDAHAAIRQVIAGTTKATPSLSSSCLGWQ